MSSARFINPLVQFGKISFDLVGTIEGIEQRQNVNFPAETSDEDLRSFAINFLALSEDAVVDIDRPAPKNEE